MLADAWSKCPRSRWPKSQVCVRSPECPSAAPGGRGACNDRRPAELVGLAVATVLAQKRPTAAQRAGATAQRDGSGTWWTDLDQEILQVWPAAVANLILPGLVGAVDLFWIAQSGDPMKIAGMGATNQIYNTIYFLLSFLPTILTPRIAEEFAQNRPKEAAKWVTEAFSFAVLMGLCGTIALVCYPHAVLRMITTNPDVLGNAVPYCRIRGFSLIATLCSSVSFATFRGLLDFETPLRVALATNVVNALLDPVLMNTLGLGVSGVALATTFAEVGGAVVLTMLLRRRKLLSKTPTLPAMSTVETFVKSGVAVQVRATLTNLMFLLAVRRVTEMDPTGVQAAAYQVTQQFWHLAGYVSLALSSPGAGLVPNKYFQEGGGIDEARRLADRLYLWGGCLGIVLCFLQLACLPLVGILAPIKEVQEAARSPAILAALLQIINGIVFAGEGILVGLKAYRWLAASSGIGCGCM
ncbi:Protein DETOXIFICATION 44, partial [Durusdinium trenchii]